MSSRHGGPTAFDAGLARALGATSLVAFALGGAGHDLHGRPDVSTVQLVELALIAAFVVWGLHRVLAGRPGYFTYFVIAFVTLWEGVTCSRRSVTASYCWRFRR